MALKKILSAVLSLSLLAGVLAIGKSGHIARKKRPFQQPICR